jgi:hypothetical protein
MYEFILILYMLFIKNHFEITIYTEFIRKIL